MKIKDSIKNHTKVDSIVWTNWTLDSSVVDSGKRKAGKKKTLCAIFIVAEPTWETALVSITFLMPEVTLMNH